MSNPLPTLSDPTYHIVAELGSGGGGVVYKAWHTRLQKYVVLKELKSGAAHDVGTQRNEAEALKNVKSAYLPQVFDFLTDGGRVFTVIEFVEGESLDKPLARGIRFSQAQVVKWYGQLASALEAIHRQNVCHRDIKPANIMITPAGDVCLIDFNAALVSGSDVRLVSRSLGYASPEQYAVYEQFRNSRSAPMSFGSSNVNAPYSGSPAGFPGGGPGMETGRVPDGAETERVGTDVGIGADPRESRRPPPQQQAPPQYAPYQPRQQQQQQQYAPQQHYSPPMQPSPPQQQYAPPPMLYGIDWKRSDIYSLGATMYHLLTGVRPPERAAETVPLSRAGRFSEGIVYIVEQSMRFDPAERFASAETVAEAVRNIHKHDFRWRASRAKRIAAAIILPVLFALFAATALLGTRVMAQEKEERFYTAVYNIEHGSDPDSAYAEALEMFDRIDPYSAMTMRLWNDGDLDACRRYIEANLGNIAQFQSDEDSRRPFGDIYYILGNCYYYQPGEPDYGMARGNFEIAVRFVRDNPIYFRDYAVTLARTGEIGEAENVMAKARSLDLDTDSLNLLNGEIAYAKREYDSAVDYFGLVISHSADDYLRYRAYHTSDEIFKLLGQPERSVELLSGAMERIPQNRVYEMTERLADAYYRSGDYKNAIILFERLAETGAPMFHILEALAILRHETGDLDGASAVLNRMADAFPGDYRIPMRRAFIEIDRQILIPNEARDYTLTTRYYNEAAALYAPKPGEADPEMQRLDLMIDELRRHGWI